MSTRKGPDAASDNHVALSSDRPAFVADGSGVRRRPATAHQCQEPGAYSKRKHAIPQLARIISASSATSTSRGPNSCAKMRVYGRALGANLWPSIVEIRFQLAARVVICGQGSHI